MSSNSINYNTFAQQNNHVNPVDNAGYWSLLVHGWAASLIDIGNKRQLQTDDLWGLQPSNKIATTSDNFDAHYRNCKQSIFRAFFAMYSRQLVQIGIMEVIIVACDLYGPIALGLFLDALDNPDTNLRLQFVYICTLFLAQIIRAIVRTHLSLQVSVVGIQFTSALRHKLFEKIIALSAASNRQKNADDIVNLFSVDVWNIVEFALSAHQFWILPIQISLIVYLLYLVIGATIFLGMVVVVVVVGVNAILAHLFSIEQETLMKSKNDRMKVLNELFTNIESVKFTAWEDKFLDQVNKLRQNELASLWRFFRYVFVMMTFINCTPMLVVLSVFGAYTLIAKSLLSAKIAFSALALFKTLQDPLSNFPGVAMAMMQSLVSSKRITEFLLMEEIDQTSVVTLSDRSAQKYSKEQIVLAIEHGSFGWSPTTVLFSQLNVKIKKGELVVVHGGNGGGKSTFLSIFLGSLAKLCGNVFVGGDIAFVSQQPWIQNMTIRENILFGKPFDKTKYSRVIDACGLEEDLIKLPAGDCTEIGQRGINLSGGEKARISLARACYSDSDILLLDEPLAAMDFKAQKSVFMKSIVGLLQHKTVVLVTCNEDVINSNYIDQSVHVEFGQVILKFNPVKEKPPKQPLSPKKSPLTNRLAYWEKEMDAIEKNPFPVFPSKRLFRPPSKRRVSFNQLAVNGDCAESRVSKEVLKKFVEDSGGVGAIIGIALTTAMMQASRVATDLWLVRWTSDSVQNNFQYFEGFCFLASINFVLVLVHIILVVFCVSKASKIFFDQALTRVLQSPLRFFDTNPIGRLLNRFSDDVSACDFQIPSSLGPLLAEGSSVLFTIVTIMVFIRWLGLSILLLLYFYFSLGAHFLGPLRDLQRIQKSTRAPVLSHVSECVEGVVTIRAYGARQILRAHAAHHIKVDQYGESHFALVAINQWFSLRAHVLSGSIVFCILLSLVYLRASLNAAVIGLVFTYGLSIHGHLEFLVNHWALFETAIIAPVRLYGYIVAEREANTLPNTPPPCTMEYRWPCSGDITFENVSYRYSFNQDLVLRNVSFEVKHGEHIGIVGRKGAGKSTIIQAIFRMNNLSSGEIKISGVNIAQVEIKLLRRGLSIAAQNPILFRGSVRMNLDPYDQYSDDILWAALSKVKLSTTISQMIGKLDAEVDENREYFSVGVRQLICLARAILMEAKIVIMEEANTAIDPSTNDILQRVRREEFPTSTVLTVSNRLDSILDSSRIMVFDHGELVQFDSPKALIQAGCGVFYDLVNEGGFVNGHASSASPLFDGR